VDVGPWLEENGRRPSPAQTLLEEEELEEEEEGDYDEDGEDWEGKEGVVKIDETDPFWQ
jgi:hypothetical protein